MFVVIIFVSSHQISKFKRWQKVMIKDFWKWQEVWLIIAVLIVGNVIWFTV
jgi:hypothetical protein